MNNDAPVMGECLTSEELESFAYGLAVAEEQRIATHLASCETCADRFHRLESSSEFLEAVMLDADPFQELNEEPALGDLLSRVKSISQQDKPNANESEPSDLSTLKQGSETPTDSWQLAATDKTSDTRLRIGNYPVLTQIGQGGFAKVYKAKDPQTNQFMAIKVLHPEIVAEVGTDQLLEEARTAGELDHPAIVKVIDWGREQGGHCYVVMQFIAGTTLRERMRAGPIDPGVAATIIKQIANALDYAHQRGLYHRDVKPENILLDDQGNAHLSDFGLAIQEEKRWDHDGEFAGTRAYMAPEQVSKSAVQIDGRMDIWSLGVILYEALTGSRPFVGKHDQLLAEIRSKNPRHPQAINPKLPDDLCEICLKCLEKDPTDRFQSAHHLAKRLRRPRRMNRPMIAAVAAVSVVVLVVVAQQLGFFGSLGIDSPSGGADKSPEVVENRELKAGQWNKVLDFPLEKLMWPGPDSDSELLEDYELESVTAVVDGRALLSAGEVAGGDVHFKVTINQPNWPGGFAFVYGLKPIAGGYRCAAFELIRDFDRFSRPQYRIDQHIYELDSEFNATLIQGVESVPISPPEGRQELQVVFEEGTLQRVTWAGNDMIEFIDNDMPDNQSANGKGVFGFFLEDSTTTLTNFRVYIH